MAKLTFYEQVGIVIPGSLLLFGLMFYIPELHDLLAKDGISVGGLGIFVLVAYAIGHLLAAVGNVIEGAYWGLRGGMPSSWVIGPSPRILSEEQIVSLEKLVAARLGLTIRPLREMVPKAWFPISRQIYADVERYGRPARLDIFNGNYGLNRGLCGAVMAMAVVSVFLSTAPWRVGGGLVVLAAAFFFRMHRFGVHYASELYAQFLLLPPTPRKPATASEGARAQGE